MVKMMVFLLEVVAGSIPAAKVTFLSLMDRYITNRFYCLLLYHVFIFEPELTPLNVDVP